MERCGADHYQQLGWADGRKMMEAHGVECFAAIGRLGGARKKELQEGNAPRDRD
jgi:hypothetical protein